MIDQQNIEIYRRIVRFKRQNAKNFGSLAPLARNHLWNFSSLYPFNKASYIMSVTNISTCSIDNQLIYDFTINKLFWKGLRFDAKMRKISARSLRSLVIIYDKFLVPTLPIKALPPPQSLDPRYATELQYTYNLKLELTK